VLALGRARANRQGVGPDTLDVRGDGGWTAWLSCAGAPPWGQPLDQRPDEAFSLVYDWTVPEEEEGEELEILGHPFVRARVAASAPVAYLSAKLCDVHPDGISQLVTRGLLNLAHRDSREAPSALEPGRTYEVSFELEATSWVFEPGHRIRLDLAGTDWPNCWPPPAPVTLTIERDGSSIALPVVDGPSPIAEPPKLPAPRRPQTWNTDDVTWSIEQDVVRKQTRAVVAYATRSDADEVAPSIVERNGGVVGVATDDPGRSWVDASSSYELSWLETTVSTAVRSRIESDADAYRVLLEIDASENGEVRWSRRFDRRFPRNLQ
jgi:hypothetical protein